VTTNDDFRRPLPPWPDDEWGRWLRPTGLADGSMWVRPARVAEQSPAIETLSQQRAARILESWLFDASEREFVHKLHARLCRLSAHLEPEGRWEQVTRELRLAFATGRVVIQRPRPPDGLPGTQPVDPPRPAPERPRLPEPRQELTWIEIEIVDEAGDAIVGEPISVVDPAGARKPLTTNEQGLARLEGIDPGACEISFPRIDGREWARKGAAFPTGGDDVERVHPVQPRECMSRVAFRYAFRSGDTLWNHDVNAELRGTGRDPDVLWPGDRVHILVRDDRSDEAATGSRHHFVVKTAVRWLRLVLHDVFRKPLASVPYVLELRGGPTRSNTTGADGSLEEIIPPWVTEGVVTAGDFVWHLAIADLRPVENAPDRGDEGVLRRLRNLGCPAARDAVTRRSTESARETTEATEEETAGSFDADVFMHQALVGWRTSGELDAETKARVVDEFGV
jgi:hypothetical protein